MCRRDRACGGARGGDPSGAGTGKVRTDERRIDLAQRGCGSQRIHDIQHAAPHRLDSNDDEGRVAAAQYEILRCSVMALCHVPGAVLDAQPPSSSAGSTSVVCRLSIAFQARILSMVIGNSRMRLPVAWNTALATAAAVPTMPISPRPFTPMGLALSSSSTKITSMSWMSA